MQISRLKAMGKAESARLLARGGGRTSEIRDYVAAIMADVREHGDEAVRRYTKQFDGVDLVDFLVKPEEIKAAYRQVDPDLVDSMRLAIKNIEKFHSRQMEAEPKVEVAPG